MATTPNGAQTFFPIPQQTYTACLTIVVKAQTTWAAMVQQFAAENIAMGITQAGKTGLIGTALQEVNMYGSVGSLWQAYDALNRVHITSDMAPFLTPERIQWMKNQMIAAISSIS